MKSLQFVAISFVIMSFFLASCTKEDSTPKYVDTTEEQKNINLVRKALYEAFDKQDTTLIPVLYHADYIQHSPSIEDGREGLLKAFKFFQSQNVEITRETPRIMAQGDLVGVQARVTFQPWNSTAIVYDLFRIKDGQIIEHWDVQMSEPNPAVSPVNGNTMIDGGGDVNKKVTQEYLDKNTKAVQDFIHEGFAKGNKTLLESLFGAEYIQHNPQVPNGKEAVLGFIKDGEGFPAEIKRIMAMGDLVMALVHYKDATGETNGNAAVDLFRFDDNSKIVEHWDVGQAIPADSTFVHNNGFF